MLISNTRITSQLEAHDQQIQQTIRLLALANLRLSQVRVSQLLMGQSEIGHRAVIDCPMTYSFPHRDLGWAGTGDQKPAGPAVTVG